MSDAKTLQLAVRAIEGFRERCADLERQLAEAQGKLDAVEAVRWRLSAIEGYIAAGGHRGWLYNSSPFLIPYVLARILKGEK